MPLLTRDIAFGRKFYIVEIGGDRADVYDWTVKTFGPPEHDAKGHRWFVTDDEYWFHKQSDRDWLIMRWSNGD